MELLVGILGAGVGSGIMAIIQTWLQHKWKNEDNYNQQIEAITIALKEMMVDRIKQLASTYINAGEISIEDKENLIKMHTAYEGLGGNGRLDPVMNEVGKIRVIA